MQSNTPPARGSLTMLWIGRVLSAVPVLMMVFSAAMKLMKPPELSTEFERLGWKDHHTFYLGILELVCVAIYAIPQTSVLGAILLTGYLGGAVATHARIDENFIGPVVFGILIWLGLYLRCGRVRALIPIRK